MKHSARLHDEEVKTIAMRKSTHDALTSLLYDLRVPKYEDAILKLLVFYEKNKE